MVVCPLGKDFKSVNKLLANGWRVLYTESSGEGVNKWVLIHLVKIPESLMEWDSDEDGEEIPKKHYESKSALLGDAEFVNKLLANGWVMTNLNSFSETSFPLFPPLGFFDENGAPRDGWVRGWFGK